MTHLGEWRRAHMHVVKGIMTTEWLGDGYGVDRGVRAGATPPPRVRVPCPVYYTSTIKTLPTHVFDSFKKTECVKHTSMLPDAKQLYIFTIASASRTIPYLEEG
ncbi:hypothetical protein J6590_039818 [Homalodisca vitripennis]|nr:hypothetical protein J6590_039818 [Homalodisca vitripennis]